MGTGQLLPGDSVWAAGRAGRARDDRGGRHTTSEAAGYSEMTVIMGLQQDG